MDDKLNMTVQEFVRGLAWHDVGKPFAQQNWRHARLGYWLLWRAGYPAEALVALRHDKGVRNQYFQAKGAEARVPAITMLANALDRLAASVYSFQPHPDRTFRHAWQNPFSRLPAPGALQEGDDRLVVGGETRQEAQKKLAACEQQLWEAYISRLPPPWPQHLTTEVKAAVEDRKAPLPIDMETLAEGEIALAELLNALDIYPERTYSPMNDTSLRQHGRLTSILGFVVYCNLEQDPEIDVDETMDSQYRGHYLNHEALVRTHLHAHLLRLTFTGIEALARQAGRVDDLHGALTLAARFRAAFKKALAAQWDAPDLAPWLAVSESQFDLVYLLPGADVDPLRARVEAAYQATVQDVAATLMHGRLARDFPEIGAQSEVLVQQLSTLTYSTRWLPVPLPEGHAKFDDFAAAYGRNVLTAYLKSQQDARAVLPPVDPDEGAPLAAEDTCEVCGTHPVLEPPADLDADAQARWLERRAYAAHTFRGERERLCLACVARRTLAYGDIAKRMDALTHTMMVPVPGKPGRWQRAAEPPDGLSLPPALSATVQVERDDELRDIGAFYARRRRGAQDALDLFPTTTYAADAYGNVVLLALQPTWALYASYIYQEALTTQHNKALNDDPVVQGWQQTFVAFHAEQAEKNPAFAASIVKVEPHLARVMERIAWIKRFYQALEDALEAAKIRVLPLDVEFPTLRLLTPADQLDNVLQVLDETVTAALFSANVPADRKARDDLHTLLKLLVPNLLHGAVVLFKHKFPLYLALDAERELFYRLVAYDRARPTVERRPSYADWYGFRMAFSDLRGTLSETGPLHATATYGNLGQVLDLVEQVDRATIEQYAATATYHTPAFAAAQAKVRAGRIQRTRREAVEEMAQDKAVYDAVHFITRAIRR